MSLKRYALDGLRKTVDNSPDDWGRLLPGTLKRDMGLEIISNGKRGYVLTARGDRFFNPKRSWTDTLAITREQLIGYVADCNKVWTDKIVYYQPSLSLAEKPFLERWDQPVDEAVLQSMGAQLARAGDRLFYHLFQQHDSPKLRRIAHHLEQASRAKELTLTITSGEFYAPWSMIYVHPEPDEELLADGSNFRWNGFWGYRHRIEHNPEDINLTTCVHPNNEGRIPTSVNIDEHLDRRLRIPCIAPQLNYFQDHKRLMVTVRKDKPSLEADFRQPPFPYRIVYFCCHGATVRDAWSLNSNQPWIRLTDREDICANDLSDWLRDRDLESRPLIFINACQSGQMHSMYYESVASGFLKKKAIGLLGAQIDMPAVFAQQYARMFFAHLLGDEHNDRTRVGEFVRTLTRTLIHKHLNPLGLAYSLYRGLDCVVDWTPIP